MFRQGAEKKEKKRKENYLKNQNSFREKKKKETFSSSSSSGLLHFHDGILYSLSLFYAARGIYIGMRFFSYSSVCVCVCVCVVHFWLTAVTWIFKWVRLSLFPAGVRRAHSKGICNQRGGIEEKVARLMMMAPPAISHTKLRSNNKNVISIKAKASKLWEESSTQQRIEFKEQQQSRIRIC